MFASKDRCDYRSMSERHLLEEARYNPNAELAVVLAERLQDEMEAHLRTKVLRKDEIGGGYHSYG